ncbi:putative nuclease HARBI1 [Hermetia illucens]|uniref:putative nuclease HARBI1 n=1 Tax=Hermetia illucens TaxID=343691 RepID=UPI0018CC3473|nr:putative nuclease HARBI1 [Hermetia illucens]
MRYLLTNVCPATLRFLASGQTFEDLKFLTAISPQSLGVLIMETCSAIIKVLKPYIKLPATEDEWKAVATEFGDRWNFPNCIGALDGKHVQIKKPNCSGSYYFNYKKTFSIVLLALVSANYEFLMVEAGANGRVSDAGVFQNSKFFEKLNDGLLNIPHSQAIPEFSEVDMPFVFVGDDAFPLLRNLMKPYSRNNLSIEERVYNYRVSRARRIVENAFGIVATRFRILINRMNLNPKKASIIVLACCYLHNFLRTTNPSVYLRGSVDIEHINNGDIQLGAWRQDSQHLSELQPTASRNAASIAKETRMKYTRYFNGVGAVPWQSLFINENNN